MPFRTTMRATLALVFAASLALGPVEARADILTSATIAVNRGVNPSILCVANAGVCSVNLGTYAGGVFTPAGLAAEILRAQTAEATNAGNISANATAITNEAATARAAEALAFPTSQAGGAARLNVGTIAGTVAPGCTIATGATACRDPASRAADRFNIRDFGAVGDTLNTKATLTIAAGSTSMSISGNPVFTAAMVGKVIDVPGAGPSGAPLVTTVASYVSGTQITMATAASTALSSSTQTISIGTDDTAALTAAVAAANLKTYWSTSHPSQPACIYIPAGDYLIKTPPAQFKGPGCVTGDGAHASVLQLDVGFSGDLFSWAEAWGAYANPGARVRGIGITGMLAAPAVQNALMFYDREDFAYVEDVLVQNLPGRALGIGILRPVPPYPYNAGQAYMRESHFRSFRAFQTGTTALPAVEITCQGSGSPDCSNEISVSQMDIFGSAGTSLAIHNTSAGIVRDIKFDNLRVEGYGGSGTSLGDLLQIGDTGTTGGIGHLSFTNAELIDPYTGYASIHVLCGSCAAGAGPGRIYYQGFIGGGAALGRGIQIDNGSLIKFDIDQIRTNDTNVTIGPSVTGVFIDGLGAETGWTYSIDPTSLAGVTSPLRRSGNPAATGASGGTAAVSGTVSADAVAASGLKIGAGGVTVNGGSVTACPLTGSARGSFTGAVGALPPLTIGPPAAGGVQAVCAATTMSFSQIINNAALSGTGYAVNDVLTLVGGTLNTGNSALQVKVLTIDGNGKPLTFSVTNFAQYIALPPDVATLTGGTGTGATIRVGFYISNTTVTTPGSGYATGPSIASAPYNTAAGIYTAASGTATVNTSLPFSAAAGALTLDQNGTTLGTSGTTGGAVRSLGAQHFGATTFVASASVTSGATQSAAANTDGMVLGNTAAVSTQTVKLPVITGLSGQVFTLSSDGGITTLTLQTSSGGTITNSPTTLAAGVGRTLISDGTAWHVRQ